MMIRITTFSLALVFVACAAPPKAPPMAGSEALSHVGSGLVALVEPQEGGYDSAVVVQQKDGQTEVHFFRAARKDESIIWKERHVTEALGSGEVSAVEWFAPQKEGQPDPPLFLTLLTKTPDDLRGRALVVDTDAEIRRSVDFHIVLPDGEGWLPAGLKLGPHKTASGGLEVHDQPVWTKMGTAKEPVSVLRSWRYRHFPLTSAKAGKEIVRKMQPVDIILQAQAEEDTEISSEWLAAASDNNIRTSSSFRAPSRILINAKSPMNAIEIAFGCELHKQPAKLLLKTESSQEVILPGEGGFTTEAFTTGGGHFDQGVWRQWVALKKPATKVILGLGAEGQSHCLREVRAIGWGPDRFLNGLSNGLPNENIETSLDTARPEE